VKKVSDRRVELGVERDDILSGLERAENDARAVFQRAGRLDDDVDLLELGGRDSVPRHGRQPVRDRLGEGGGVVAHQRLGESGCGARLDGDLRTPGHDQSNTHPRRERDLLYQAAPHEPCADHDDGHVPALGCAVSEAGQERHRRRGYSIDRL
jgi:hypothetical protein